MQRSHGAEIERDEYDMRTRTRELVSGIKGITCGVFFRALLPLTRQVSWNAAIAMLPPYLPLVTSTLLLFFFRFLYCNRRPVLHGRKTSTAQKDDINDASQTSVPPKSSLRRCFSNCQSFLPLAFAETDGPHAWLTSDVANVEYI